MTLARSLRPIKSNDLLNENRVGGLANIHVDDGRRQLSQLSPGTEKVPRHDGKFRASASNRSRVRHTS